MQLPKWLASLDSLTPADTKDMPGAYHTASYPGYRQVEEFAPEGMWEKTKAVRAKAA